MAVAEKASLTQRVIDKVLPKLHDEDVYDVNGLRAQHSIDGLGDVFSRVVAAQVADALDALDFFSQISLFVSSFTISLIATEPQTLRSAIGVARAATPP